MQFLREKIICGYGNELRHFELIKKKIMQSPCWRYFDENKFVTLSSDAIKKRNCGRMVIVHKNPADICID